MAVKTATIDHLRFVAHSDFGLGTPTDNFLSMPLTRSSSCFARLALPRSTKSKAKLSSQVQDSDKGNGPGNAQKLAQHSVKAVKHEVELDSGSTVHVTGDNTLLSSYLSRTSTVCLADNRRTSTLGSGSLRLTDGSVVISLSDTLHMPQAQTLISVSALESTGWLVDLCTGHPITATNPSLGLVMCFSRSVGRLVPTALRRISASVSAV
ncbi:hypothetical protein V1514DRAFT_329321, partial [Lipomyces japonicus]|uniref:uncharacterized protein n=1 Tax=Lipomyces japonicus TaxID=56871 RepID=UPI0034CFC8B0